MENHHRIFVAGHRGLVGSSIVRCLRKKGFDNLVLIDRNSIDLTNQKQVEDMMSSERPDYVFLAAARVGGILANSQFPADFIRDNLNIQVNVIDSAYRNGVKKLLFLGSSCIYPRNSPQPIREEYLLTGELETTNEWYAIAKIAGLKMCQAYRKQYGFDAISLMPTNLYGPHDNFDLTSSHVIPALIRKFHEACKNGDGKVEIWGSGRPRREFLHVDDLADACVFLMQRYSESSPINVGTGKEITIMDLARLVAEVTGFEGKIVCDESKPDGTLRKRLDVERVTALGWRASIGLSRGISETYQWFRENESTFRG